MTTPIRLRVNLAGRVDKSKSQGYHREGNLGKSKSRGYHREGNLGRPVFYHIETEDFDQVVKDVNKLFGTDHLRLAFEDGTLYTCINDFRDNDLVYLIMDSDESSEEEIAKLEIKCNVLDLSYKFKQYTIHDLAEIRNKDDVLKLDLRYNQLQFLDLPFIHECCLLFPNCEFLNLSGNSIRGERQSDYLFTQILDSMLYVDVTYNSIGSITRKDLIMNLTDEQLNKFIWVPQKYLPANGWKTVVDNNPDKIKIISRAHSDYYSLELIRQRYEC
jgi:hypothetical protein